MATIATVADSASVYHAVAVDRLWQWCASPPLCPTRCPELASRSERRLCCGPGGRPDASNGRFAPGGWTRFDPAHDPERDPYTAAASPTARDFWLIYFGDVHVGSVGRAVGTPGAAERWVWFCGFYPGSNPGEQTNGTAATFDAARAAFEKAWLMFSARRTEADYRGVARAARLDRAEVCGCGIAANGYRRGR